MAIGKIFAHRAYTDNGNEYKKSNYAKTTCTALGATGAAIGVHKMNKLLQAACDEFKSSGAIEEGMESFADLIPKGFKYAKKSMVVAGAIGVGLAFGVGAIIDGIANSVKRHKADKAANNIA